MAKTPPPNPRRTPPAVPAPGQPPAAPAPKPEPTPAPKSAKPDAGDRLTIPLDKDGRPDFASMREKTRARVKSLVSDPAVARELGIDAAPAVAMIPRELTNAAITALGQLDTIIIARVTRAPAPIVLAIGPYSKEEREQIAPALENVLNKYAPAALNKWADEIALAVMLSSLTMRKIEGVRAAMQAIPRGPATVVQHPSSPQPPAEPAPNAAPPAGDVPPETFQ